MRELLTRVKCPVGCENPIFTESVRIVMEENNNLLQEGKRPATKRIKTYTCHCCGNSFDLFENNSSGRMVL